MYIMSPQVQEFWEHAVPKKRRLQDPRISLTFRQVAIGPAVSSPTPIADTIPNPGSVSVQESSEDSFPEDLKTEDKDPDPGAVAALGPLEDKDAGSS